MWLNRPRCRYGYSAFFLIHSVSSFVTNFSVYRVGDSPSPKSKPSKVCVLCVIKHIATPHRGTHNNLDEMLTLTPCSRWIRIGVCVRFSLLCPPTFSSCFMNRCYVPKGTGFYPGRWSKGSHLLPWYWDKGKVTPSVMQITPIPPFTCWVAFHLAPN